MPEERLSPKEGEIDRLVSMVGDWTGMLIPEARRPFLSRILSAYAEESDCLPSEYLAMISRPEGLGERRRLIEGIIVGETSFFRTKGHFDFLARTVAPELSGRGAAVRCWSAGCSTGCEAYSIALVLNAKMEGEFEVLGTDIGSVPLETARRGVYPERMLEGIPSIYRSVTRPADSGDGFSFSEEILRTVRFEYHNLASDIYPLDLDIIFCRNVLIYFPEDFAARIVERLTGSLREGGYLFLGGTETLLRRDSGLEAVMLPDAVAYRKPERFRPKRLRAAPMPEIRPAASPPGGVDKNTHKKAAEAGAEVKIMGDPFDSADFKEKLKNLIEADAKSVVLDLQAVSFIDAEFVRILERAARIIKQRGGRISVRSANPNISRMLSRSNERLGIIAVEEKP